MCECIDTLGILVRHIIEKIFYNIMITLKHIFRNVTHSSLGRMSPCVKRFLLFFLSLKPDDVRICCRSHVFHFKKK